MLLSLTIVASCLQRFALRRGDCQGSAGQDSSQIPKFGGSKIPSSLHYGAASPVLRTHEASSRPLIVICTPSTPLGRAVACEGGLG